MKGNKKIYNSVVSILLILSMIVIPSANNEVKAAVVPQATVMNATATNATGSAIIMNRNKKRILLINKISEFSILLTRRGEGKYEKENSFINYYINNGVRFYL